MQCLILAGGLGTRMRRWTAEVPKSLIPVAGRPFLDWQLDWLAANDVQEVVLSVGYLGQMIVDHVGDGSAWRIQVDYVHEHDELLGTGGALRLAVDRGVLDDRALVLYGDSYLPIELAPVMSAFEASRCPALMTVWRNVGSPDESNVGYEGGLVHRYDKFANGPLPMGHIDYGLSVVTRDVVMSEIPSREPRDLGDFFAILAADGRLAGFEIRHRFYEIGSQRGLEELEECLSAGGGR